MSRVYLGIQIDDSRDELLTEPAKDLIKGFYTSGKETIQERLARACVAWSDDLAHAQRLYDANSLLHFMWSSPMLSNAPLLKEEIWVAGMANQSLPIWDHEDDFEHNGSQNISCFLPMVSDSIPSLLMGKLETSLLSVIGGGIGKYFDVRYVSDKSPGPIPFVIEDDASILAWKQGKVRRGAEAAWLSANHGSAKEFLKIRTPTGDSNRKAENIHIGFSIDDDLMERIRDGEKEYHLIDPHTKRVIDTVNPAEYFQSMLTERGRTGEPFMYFRGNANRALPEAQKRLGLYSYASNLCLSEDTLVMVADGRKPITVKQLARESSGSIPFKVWSGKVVGGRVIPEVKTATARLTGRKELVTVVLNSGERFQCTKDHELFTTQGHRVKAKDSIGKRLDARLYRNGNVSNVNSDPIVAELIFDGAIKEVYCLEVEDNHNFYISISGEGHSHKMLLVSNCTEITLPANDDRTPVCCLSSLNAEYSDVWAPTLVGDLVRALDNALEHFIRTADWIANRYTNPRHRELIKLALHKVINSAKQERSIGLGVMGLHYAFQKHGMPFESPEAKQFNIDLFRSIKEQAVAESLRLGAERGECPDAASSTDHPHVGRRNMHLLAIAPNSNNADMLTTSASCEPEYANIYTKETRVGIFERRNPYLKEILQKYGIDNEETWTDIANNEGSVAHLKQLTDLERAIFKTAFEIDQMCIVRLAADRQPNICQAQSLNLFFKPGSDINHVFACHYHAWLWGLKSLYYYRTKPEVEIETLSQALVRKALKDSEKKEKEKGENIVYGTKVCPNCNTVKRMLSDMGLDFKFVDLQQVGKTAAEVTGDPSIRSVPQVFLNGEWIGGMKEVQALYKEHKAQADTLFEDKECSNCQG
ncbi:ribonucleotide-diphosphate reductase subunit alpha [Acinetobacter phage SH-Ab 15599]|nr:ribonucleotide-diphosphate reductase subunit alpha [Acinetobacter phage SH-Ab 15599]